VRNPLGPASLFLILSAHSSLLAAQAPPDLERERSDFTRWLASDPLSPFAIVALMPIGAGVSVGPEPSDILIPGQTRGIARESGGGAALELPSGRVVLPRGRPVVYEGYRLVSSGLPGKSVLAAYGPIHGYHPPRYFPYDARLVFTLPMEQPERHGAFRILGLDGTETEAVEAGSVSVPIGGSQSRLRVYRVGDPDRDEESELVIFFRDRTNGQGSYPAGRFLELTPKSDGSVLLDFNRARNPFCAYSTVFPCPAPWPGNAIAVRLSVGEQYGPAGGGQ